MIKLLKEQGFISLRLPLIFPCPILFSAESQFQHREWRWVRVAHVFSFRKNDLETVWVSIPWFLLFAVIWSPSIFKSLPKDDDSIWYYLYLFFEIASRKLWLKIVIFSFELSIVLPKRFKHLLQPLKLSEDLIKLFLIFVDLGEIAIHFGLNHMEFCLKVVVLLDRVLHINLKGLIFFDELMIGWLPTSCFLYL